MKEFDTVDHDIFLKKLDMYGIKEKILKSFQSYLTNRTQFLKYLEGSILRPLLFLIFVNDLKKSTKLLNPKMFADDTNLFYTNKNIKV